jgi:hypothetical protein
MELLKVVLSNNTIKKTSELLNVAPGTIQRWIQLKKVPGEYTFDLHRILSLKINYSDYSITEKNQFFTPDNLVKRCWNKITEVVSNYTEYTFIEPSAGDGNFLKFIPPEVKVIAMDIEPMNEKIISQDYLLWTPENKNKIIVFGNPPFGLRGHLALQFINHSASFADYICFILPQLFDSDGKGSPKKRIKGYHCISTEKIREYFYTPGSKKEVLINGVFQIWAKGNGNGNSSIIKQDLLKVYSLSDGGTPSTSRNIKMIDKCDIYLPSTCFGKEKMTVYSTFEELPNRKGYGVIFLKNKKEMALKSKNTDWSSVAFLSTNSAYNLRSSLIIENFV